MNFSRKTFSAAGAAAALACLAAPNIAAAQAPQPVKVAIPVFLSGPAMGAFGEPSRNAAQMVIKALNAGEVPAPYNSKGIAGAPIEPKFFDEAGSGATVVTEFRNAVQRDNVDAVIGYVSSGGCLAVAPVAEELKVLTIFYACGSPRLFEERSYKYVFRTTAITTADSVAAARYVLSRNPAIKSYSGINQNYSWGQDNWRDFQLAMKTLAPQVKIDKELMPKLFAGEYGAEISVLLAAGSPIVHSSFFGGDLESLVLQTSARGLPQRSRLLLTVGEQILARQAKNVPDGSYIGARGQHGALSPGNPLNTWFMNAYVKEFGVEPNFPSYHMFTSILALKTAWEKAAAANGGKRPDVDALAKALTGLEFETASGLVKLARNNGHQAVESVAMATYRFNKTTNKPELYDVEVYPVECVYPPNEMTSEEWLTKGMPGAKCK